MRSKPETCPTPALLWAQARGERIPASRWEHHCSGLLGKYQGKNLHWMVCTELVGDVDPELLEYLRRFGKSISVFRQKVEDFVSDDEKVDRMAAFAGKLVALSNVADRGTCQ